jgi:ParB/RepB/Spo0J family partition protein
VDNRVQEKHHMTSGEFRSIEVESIKVDRAQRQRREIKPTYIRELADSIRRLGLIHPIVVKRDLELVVGECRLLAVKLLGWTRVQCQYVDEVDDPAVLREIELEENVKRSELSWQDRCVAVADYHDLRSDTEPDWTQDKTAQALGMDQTNVSIYVAAAREIRQGNAKVIEAGALSTARGIIERNAARRDAQTFRELEKITSEILGEEPAPSVLNEDFIKWAPAYTGPKFNFIHCDFPFGIDTDKRQQGNSVAIHGGYEDSPDTYWRLVEALCKNLDRFCTESAHIMFWFSMHYYHDTLEYFAKHSDFEFRDPRPLIWHKSDGKGLLPDPQRGPRCVYETCLFGSRGDRLIVSAVSNLYPAATDSSQHISAKPEPMLRHFFRMFVDTSTIMLDPTCGSGTALRAAEGLGAKYVLGLEINPEFVEDAQLSLGVARRVIKSRAAVL